MKPLFCILPFICACALGSGGNRPADFWGLSVTPDNPGILLGHDQSGKDDLPLGKTCQSQTTKVSPCIVQLEETYFSFKKERERCEIQLSECQKKCQ